jgi:hypothetical protein
MNTTLRALALAAALGLAPSVVQAQGATLGPALGYHDDFDFGVGAVLSLPVPAIDERANFVADFLYFFPDSDFVDYFELNANLTFDFVVEGSSVVPFALGGLNIALPSVEVGNVSESSTELGLNVGGGIRFDVGTLRPSVGFRLEIEGGDGYVIFATVPFAVGG